MFLQRIPSGTVDEFKMIDLRVLPAKFVNQGDRRRVFHDALESMVNEEPEGGLVVIKGPRTAMWALRDMLENGGSPQAHFDW